MPELASHVDHARPSCNSNQAKLCLKSYGRPCARPAVRRTMKMRPGAKTGRPRPGAGDVLAERFRAGIQRCEAAGASLPTDLGVEVRCVSPCAERPGAVPSVLTPTHPPYDLAAIPLDLLDAHRRPLLPAPAHSTERSKGPDAFGAGAQRPRRCGDDSDGVAHSRTASAEMSQRSPCLAAASSRRAMAEPIVFGDTRARRRATPRCRRSVCRLAPSVGAGGARAAGPTRPRQRFGDAALSGLGGALRRGH